MRHQAISAEAQDQKGAFGGVALIDLLARAGVPSGDDLEDKDLTKIVLVTGADGYQVSFALAELDSAFTDRVVLVADSKDGKPLPANAAPYQIVVPGEKRPARWVRQVISMTSSTRVAGSPSAPRIRGAPQSQGGARLESWTSGFRRFSPRLRVP